MSHDTIVTFIVLDFTEKLLINKLILKVTNIIININNNKPTVKIKNYPKNVDDYYVEKLELISDEKIKRYFRFRVYKYRTNLYYILLNVLNNFAFEIGYFNKSNFKLPQNLDIKIGNNVYNLKAICETDLPFINSFGIINCDKSIIINDKKEIFLDEEEKGSFNVNFIASGENYLIKILKIYKVYYPKLIKHKQSSDYLETIIKDTKNKLNDKNISKSEFSIFLTEHINIWKKLYLYLEDYKHYITNKIYPLDDEDYSLLLHYIIYLILEKVNKHTESYPILKCFFNLLLKLENKMKEKLINQRDILAFTYYFYEHYCSIEKYKDCLDQKLNLYKNIYDNSLIDWLDFDIVFIKECNKESAYYKAVKLLENVLDNLKPNSKLLEILYLVDSGSGKIKNNNKFDYSKIAFNLSMISKKNIISHIKNIIPNMIIRKNKARNRKTDPYAECDIYSGIMTVYEETLFKIDFLEAKKILIDEPDENDNYTITLFLCLLHELCSHLKLLIKEKTIKSPNIINDPYDNYNDLELERAESGRTMEYYISNDINKIKFLKFSFSPKKDLYNHNLWTDENFEKLNLVIENLMKINDSKDYLSYEIDFFPSKKIRENKESKDDEDDKEISDWEYSSQGRSNDEDVFQNKPDNKTKNIEIEFENNSDIEDVKPIVKY